MNPRLTLTLRLLGPALQVIALLALIGFRPQMAREVVGIPLQSIFLALFGLGFLMVMIALTLGRSFTPTPRERPAPRKSGDLERP